MADFTSNKSRREVLIIAAAMVVTASTTRSADRPMMKVWKDPNCGCCGAWVSHLNRNGLRTRVMDVADMRSIKSRFGVPAGLGSCHTAEIDGYVIEGHVPALAISRLLKERPAGTGLSVPGMPIGSPGMEGGTPEIYDVVLFGANGSSVFARFKEDKPI
ncbi:MAG: DUF411 domain-containing protein [Hyphomicrobiaceae bacterium]